MVSGLIVLVDTIKDWGRTRENFQSTEFSKIFYELLVSEMQNLGATDFVSEIKRVENYPDFEKFALVIQRGLQGFIIRIIEAESTEANDLSHIF